MDWKNLRNLSSENNTSPLKCSQLLLLLDPSESLLQYCWVEQTRLVASLITRSLHLMVPSQSLLAMSLVWDRSYLRASSCQSYHRNQRLNVSAESHPRVPMPSRLVSLSGRNRIRRWSCLM